MINETLEVDEAKAEAVTAEIEAKAAKEMEAVLGALITRPERGPPTVVSVSTKLSPKYPDPTSLPA